MSSEATQLKLKALELKKAGDLEGAKAALAKARAIEFESITVDQLNDAGELKRLAVVLKRKGDIAGAKEALIKAKHIEAGSASGAGASTSNTVEVSSDTNRQQTTKRPSVAQQASARIPCLFSGSSKPPETNATYATETPNDPADDGRSTNYLAQTDTTVSDLREELNPSGPVTFDDDEMADIETMADLQTMGMDVPSESDYQARIKANKMAALAAKKRGDVDSAKRLLYRSKQLEAAMIELYTQKDEGSDDDEDYSLLDELNGGSNEEDDAFYAELFGAEANVLDLDDLHNFDAEMLKDMMDAGMEVPNPDDIMKQAQEKKELAVALHKDGNTVAAKSALAESKRLHAQAEQLAEMLDAIESGGDEDGDGGDMAALMVMLDGSEGGDNGAGAGGAGVKHRKEPAVATPATSVEPIKTAAEWKQEAIRFKQEGKLTEATKALRMCKQVMAEDANKAEMEKRKQLIKELNGEIEIAKEQVKRYIFYEHFVDKHVGAAQLSFWRKYITNCANAIKLVESKGLGAINIARNTTGGGKKILNEDLSFVGNHTDPNDERLEVAILDVLNIQENKHLKKALRHQLKEQKNDKKAALAPQDNPSIRVDVTIQLPPSEKESDGNISLKFDPQPSEDGEYSACPSKFVHLPRGKSRHARTVLRRMERKRIQINVVYVPSAKKGLFGVRKSKDSSHSETPLGAVVVDLKEFLSCRCVAGDFPLLDSMRRNELGGALRLGIRTGVPFDPEAVEAQAALVELTGYELAGVSAAAGTAPIDMKPYEAMTFVLRT